MNVHPENLLIYGGVYAAVFFIAFIIYKCSSWSFDKASERAELLVIFGVAVLGTWLAITYS